MKKLVALCLGLVLIPLSVFAAPFTPFQGGTGTSITPNLGDVLVGTSGGIYQPVATSTLGFISTPGGLTGQFQYNNGGVFAGSNLLTILAGNLFATTSAATSTNFFTNSFFATGLVTCNTANSALLWSNGIFGCTTISSGSPYPFPLTGNATSTLTGFNGGIFALASSTFQTLTFTNATGSSATTTSFFSTNASTTNLFGTNISGFGLSSCSGTSALTFSGTTFGCTAIPQGTVTSVTATYPVQSTGGATPLISLAFGTTTNNLWSGTNIFQNATTTIVGGLTIGGNATVTNATSTNLYVSNLFSALSASSTNLYVSGSSTLQRVTFTNGTSTQATTTALNVSSTFTSNGLVACNSASNAVTWSAGVFGCNTITSSTNTDKFATTTNNSALRPNGGTNIGLVIGETATTTNSLLEVVGGANFDRSTSTQATSTNLYTSGQSILAATSGSVGIGTTSPTNLLTVAQSTGETSVRLSTANSGNNILFDRAGTVYTSIDSPYLSPGDFAISQDSASRVPFYINTSGNVGIGTTTPQGPLQVAYGSNAPVIIGDLNTSDATGGLYVQGANDGSSGGLTSVSRSNITFNPTLSTNFVKLQEAFNSSVGYIGLGGTDDFQIITGLTNAGSSNTSGTPRLTVKNSGNVGVGTTSPVAKLDVYNSGGGAAGLEVTGNDPSNALLTLKNKANSTNDTFSLVAGVTGVTQDNFSIYDSVAAATRLTILNTGQVGIGTTNPTQLLHIFGTAPMVEVEGNGITSAQVKFRTNGSDRWFIGDPSASSDFRFNNGSSDVLTIQNGGNVGIGTVSPAAALDVQAPSGTDFAMQVEGNSSVGGYERIYDAFNSVTRGFIGYGTTLFSNFGISDFGIRSQGGLVLSGSGGNFGLYVNPSNNVGIGTQNPITPLQVGTTSTANTNAITLGTAYSADSLARGSISWNDGTAITGQIDTRYDGASVGMTFGSLYSSGYNSTPVMTIRQGNVGIGTTSPSSKLAVAGDTVSGTQLLIQGSTNPNQQLLIGYSTSGDYGSIQAVKQGNAVEPISLNSVGGNVGVGITTPGFKLDVAGFINTDKFSGYYQDSKLLGYASSTNKDTIFGFFAGGQNSTTSATTGNLSAFGTQALNQNTTGTANAAFGSAALFSNTTGATNAAFGNAALEWNTTGSNNTAVGVAAGQTGVGVFQRDTFIGEDTNQNPSVGILDTTELGYKAGFNNTGWDSTLIGEQAGQNLAAGNNNIAIGFNALLPSTSASNQMNIGNIIFGTGLTATSASATVIPSLTGNIGIATTSPWKTFSVNGNVSFVGLNTAAITDSAICLTANNEIVVNSGATSCLVSSLRFKHDVTSLSDSTSLDNIMKLNPVAFEYNGTNQKSQGLIAEQVQKVLPLAVDYDKAGQVQSIEYSQVDANLIGAVQAMQKEIKNLKVGVAKPIRSVEENWQWGVIGLLGVGWMNNRRKIKRLEERLK